MTSSNIKLDSNLNRKETKGMKKLAKRDDIVIFQTDKSSRFSVDDKTNYIKANQTHVVNDLQPATKRSERPFNNVGSVPQSR